ncbi:putative RNA-binding protein 19 [Lamellibrachia satsuma]|nr:putative RNA-binding protein 19 [Lamellibrachia satsuma]
MKEENTETANKKQVRTKDSSSSESEDDEAPEPGSTLFVKNLNFDTTQDKLTQIFSKCGKLRAVSISKKKDMKNPGSFLSLGYGFVEFKTASAANQALKELQHASIDGHKVELKVSNRATIQPAAPRKKQNTKKKQKSTKILIRNIPFEATLKEIRELFGVFGEIKSLRIPKKMSGTGSHRGFGFVDFLTKQDAKRAFNALCHSTHLYGRRLVLEWADSAESVEQLRRKTADHFHDGGPTKRLKKSAVLEQLNPSRDLV